MGLFGNKNSIIGTALGVSGAFDKSKKTDRAAAFGAALGASIGSGQKWTMADSIRLGASIKALDSMKENSASNYTHSDDGYCTEEDEDDDLIFSSGQEEQLEDAGIDPFDFELMDDDEKREALEDAGLDPFDFNIY